VERLSPPTRSSVAQAVIGSGITFGAIVLLVASNVAIPLDYVARPVAAGLVGGVLIGVASAWLGRYALLAAVVLSILLAFPALWPWAAGLVVVELLIAVVARGRTSTPLPIGRFSIAAMAALLAVGAIRLLPLLPDYASAPEGAAWDGPPVYLVLLDGYPRIDTLAGLGIDNGAFVAELERRGFDHYDDATSAHQWTHRTLQALVAGSPDGIPDVPGSTEEQSRIRLELDLPGFLAIDSPAGHVTFRGGDHWSAGGINDFEAHLLGASALGMVAPGFTANVVGDSLRGHFEGSLELIAAAEADRVFAHLIAPHPPFLYAGGVSPCWPGCDIFDVSAETLGISVEEWADRMRAHLPAVNERVLRMIDDVLAKRPDAVIVLFGDHGARYGHDAAELHRPFLAARTPQRADLFAAEPHPHAILRLVTEAYP